MSSQTIQKLLEKFSDFDKDERFMAINDMQQLLRRKDLKIDNATERRICQALLQRLEKDKSNDVQTIAVACISDAVKICRDEQIAAMCDKLTAKIVQIDVEDMRDIYSIGLKTLIKVVPEKEGIGEIVTKHTVSRLLRGTKSTNETMRGECFDLLSELLRKFGEEVTESHDDIINVVMNEMEKSRDEDGEKFNNIRKRAIECLGALSLSMSGEKLSNVLRNLMAKMNQDIKKGSSVLAYVHAVVVLTDQIGNRLGQYVDALVPLLFSALENGNSNEEDSKEDDFDDMGDTMMMSETDCELRELCMNAFGLFISNCPLDVKSHIDRIVEVCLKFVSYDPNYDYGNENGDEEMDFEDDGFGGGDSDNQDEDDEFEYSDEEYNNGNEIEDADDMSWRVRKSAIGVLNNLASSTSKSSVMSTELFQQCFVAVAERFKEREEAVRIEIISCFALYVRVSVILDKQAGLLKSTPVPNLKKQNSFTEFVTSKFQDTIKISIKFLKQFEQSIKTRSAIFRMLEDSFSVLNERGQGVPLTSLRDLVPHIVSALSSSAVQLRFQAMKFFLVLLQQCSSIMPSFLKDLLPALVTCTGDDWHRLVSISLHAIAHVVRVLRPESTSSSSSSSSLSNEQDDEDAMDVTTTTTSNDDVDVTPFVLPLYNAVLPRLRKRDIDLQIKIRAIEASSLIVAHLGDKLDKERKRVLKLMTIRLKNDTTRIAAIHGIETLARSRFQLGTISELSDLFLESCITLSTYLNQQNRNVKLASLRTLIAIVRHSGTNVVGSTHLDIVCDAVAKLLRQRDLHFSHMALEFARAVLDNSNSNNKSLNSVRDKFWNHMCNLLTSSLLQGQALESLLTILQRLVCADYAIADSWLSNVFENLKSVEVSSLVIENLGRASSVIVLNAPKSKRDNLIRGFVNDLKRCVSDSSKGGDAATRKRLLLRTLGGIGTVVNLSSYNGLLESVLQCFGGDENVELVRTSAAMSLGYMAIGAKDSVFLPFILSSLSAAEKKKNGSKVDLYLISFALHNVLSSSTFDVTPHLETVLSDLLSHCENEEEGTRNVIAKCLGTLARIDSTKVFPALRDASKATSELKRSVSVMAVKFAVADEGKDDDTFSKYLPDFLNLLRDDSINVVHSTLITLNTIAHHHHSMLQSSTSFQDLWLVLFDHTKIREDLKRTVNLGPFKEKIDDGLPIRKAAYTCILTMLTTMPSHVDVNRFASYLASGLAERESDVKMLCYHIMTKICAMVNARDVLMPVLDDLMVPLARTINKRLDKVLKTKANEASIQRVRQLLFSAVRAVESLSQIESVHSNAKFLALWNTLKKNNVASSNIAGSGSGGGGGDDDDGEDGDEGDGGDAMDI